jgi:hypothetical protein
MHVSQHSKHQEEAWKFVEWLTTQLNESGRTRMGEFMAGLGSLPMIAQDMKTIFDYKDLFFSGFLTSLSIARGEPLLPEITRRQQEVRDSVFSVITGSAPLAGMLEQLQQVATLGFCALYASAVECRYLLPLKHTFHGPTSVFIGRMPEPAGVSGTYKVELPRH